MSFFTTFYHRQRLMEKASCSCATAMSMRRHGRFLMRRYDRVYSFSNGGMRYGARELRYPEPEFTAGNFFAALFRPILLMGEKDPRQEPGTSTESSRHVPHTYRTSKEHVDILKAALKPKERDALQIVAGITHRQHFYREYLHPLLDAGLLYANHTLRVSSSYFDWS